MQERAEASYAASVPAAWRAAISVRIEIIPGHTSWADSQGRIRVSETHARSSAARLSAVMSHEFGHLIAFRYGSQAYPGAAPSGWPAYSDRPEEAWADCVTTAFTGLVDPSHGLPPCTGDSLSWARSWLSQGPPR